MDTANNASVGGAFIDSNPGGEGEFFMRHAWFCACCVLFEKEPIGAMKLIKAMCIKLLKGGNTNGFSRESTCFIRDSLAGNTLGIEDPRVGGFGNDSLRREEFETGEKGYEADECEG